MASTESIKPTSPIIIFFVSIFFISACASTETTKKSWFHPNKSSSQLYEDRKVCSKQNTEQTNLYTIGRSGEKDRRDQFRKCMNGLGWKLVNVENVKEKTKTVISKYKNRFEFQNQRKSLNDLKNNFASCATDSVLKNKKNKKRFLLICMKRKGWKNKK